jgi:hypothetical protein
VPPPKPKRHQALFVMINGRHPRPTWKDRKRLREALGNTLSDEFVDVILGKLGGLHFERPHSPSAHQ